MLKRAHERCGPGIVSLRSQLPCSSLFAHSVAFEGYAMQMQLTISSQAKVEQMLVGGKAQDARRVPTRLHVCIM